VREGFGGHIDIAIDGPWDAKRILGTVPVEADGSAYFRAPANKPLYFQAVDGQGRAVQSMRSETYLRPGERRGCVGCHEPPGSRPADRSLLAVRRPPSRLQPGPEGSCPMSFALLVQPVLDQHCVRCHTGRTGPGQSKLVLTRNPAETFSRSYQNLKPFLRWYEWGEASISQTAAPSSQSTQSQNGFAGVNNGQTRPITTRTSSPR